MEITIREAEVVLWKIAACVRFTLPEAMATHIYTKYSVFCRRLAVVSTTARLFGGFLAVIGILVLGIFSFSKTSTYSWCRRDVVGTVSTSDVQRFVGCDCRREQLDDVMSGYTGSWISATDPGLISRIRDYFIDLPRPYVTKFSMPIVETPQAKEVNRILKQKVSRMQGRMRHLYWRLVLFSGGIQNNGFSC